MPFFVTVAVAILLAVLIGKANRVSRVHRSWSGVAHDLGLQISPKQLLSFPELSGVYNGVGVAVRVKVGNDNKHDYTHFAMSHHAYGPPVVLERQHALSRFGTFFGRADVELGDPFFDDRVVVNTTYEQEIRDFLTPARQAAVLHIFDRYHNAKMTQDKIMAETRGIQYTQAHCTGTIRRLADIAKVMAAPEAVEAALIRQQDGNIAEAQAALHAVNEQESNLFVETLEAEALIELGDHESAAQLFEVVDQQLTDATPADGWETLAAAPAPVLLPAPRIEAAVVSSQQQIIDDLFEGSRLSFQIVEHFENTYVGKSVTWTGTVTSEHSFRHDSDFGQGPGMKAVVSIGRSGDSRLISNEVHAIVDLPDRAKAERGDQISFTGTLLRIDRFARKIYVADAQLTSGAS